MKCYFFFPFLICATLLKCMHFCLFCCRLRCSVFLYTLTLTISLLLPLTFPLSACFVGSFFPSVASLNPNSNTARLAWLSLSLRRMRRMNSQRKWPTWRVWWRTWTPSPQAEALQSHTAEPRPQEQPGHLNEHWSQISLENDWKRIIPFIFSILHGRENLWNDENSMPFSQLGWTVPHRKCVFNVFWRIVFTYSIFLTCMCFHCVYDHFRTFIS